MGLTEVAVAAPAYNEGESIEAVVQSWVTYLASLPGVKKFEIVVCNDGSRDRTGEILDDLARRHPQIKPVHLESNQGAAAAHARAIGCTTLDWVLLIDSDGQFPIENLTAMAESVEKAGSRAVIGVRRVKQDTTFARFGSWSSGVFCNLFHGSHCKDFNSALKLVDGALLRSIPLESTGLNSSTEITSKLLERGVTLAEVEIDHRVRERGKSSLKLARGAFQRFAFVMYIGFRQLLLRLKVLRTGET